MYACMYVCIYLYRCAGQAARMAIICRPSCHQSISIYLVAAGELYLIYSF